MLHDSYLGLLTAYTACLHRCASVIVRKVLQDTPLQDKNFENRVTEGA